MPIPLNYSKECVSNQSLGNVVTLLMLNLEREPAKFGQHHKACGFIRKTITTHYRQRRVEMPDNGIDLTPSRICTYCM